MLRVLPEVVELIAEDAWERDAIVRIENLHRAAEDRIVDRTAAQLGDRRGIPGFDPFQRTLPFDVLQPDERVRALRFGRSSGNGGGSCDDFAHSAQTHVNLPRG